MSIVFLLKTKQGLLQLRDQTKHHCVLAYLHTERHYLSSVNKETDLLTIWRRHFSTRFRWFWVTLIVDFHRPITLKPHKTVV